MVSGEPAAATANETDDLARAIAARDAEVKELARAARDEAAASGTLVWDPFDPAWRHDPFAVYSELRAASPVHRSPLGFWVFTRHADCLTILRDRRSSSDGRNADPDRLAALRTVDPSDFSGGMSAVLAE